MKSLIYSCSGCSGDQMVNYIALQIDRKGIEDLSCIAGNSGNGELGKCKKTVNIAKLERKIIVIDGFPLAGSKACLNQQSIST